MRPAPFQVDLAGTLLWGLATLLLLRGVWLVTVEDAYDGNLDVAVVSIALVAGLLGLCAWAVPRGSQSARVVTGMLLLVTGTSGIASALGGSSTVLAVVGALAAAASVAVLLLLLSQPAREFYRRPRRPKKV